MSNEPSHAIYSSDHIQTIALKHAQQIQPSDACLPPHVVEIITQNTATKSLFGQLPPVENQSDIQVGYGYHELYLHVFDTNIGRFIKVFSFLRLLYAVWIYLVMILLSKLERLP